MLRASHYVLRDILFTIERDDRAELKRICAKYAERYRNDRELVDSCLMILASMRSRVYNKRVGEIRSRINELLSVRKVVSSGGTSLWFTDRRGSGRTHVTRLSKEDPCSEIDGRPVDLLSVRKKGAGVSPFLTPGLLDLSQMGKHARGMP